MDARLAGTSPSRNAEADARQLASIADSLKNDSDLSTLHHAVSDPAVTQAALQCKLVWAQVKGYPWWPVCSPEPGFEMACMACL
jgi:hypothetical protein